MTQQRRAAFAVACSECEVLKEVDDPNEGVAFYRRHHALTGHDVEWERIDFDAGDVPSGDLKAVVRELERRYDGGVPVGVVTAAMSEQRASMRETLDGLRELRMNGELYEPRDDHLSAL
ncbi:hypothetical protein [Haloprofundus halobius]|uniref:hypothetical protein n=1 Tax=Haloprofundus halobius TaxID=2876194 RepID=UPI001CCE6FC6|nr:hypothetical protein [Haloprofundus halobius]